MERKRLVRIQESWTRLGWASLGSLLWNLLEVLPLLGASRRFSQVLTRLRLLLTSQSRGCVKLLWVTFSVSMFTPTVTTVCSLPHSFLKPSPSASEVPGSREEEERTSGERWP